MNEKLIEDLREGKCCIKNDGSLEDLKKVLEYSFPKDIWKTSGRMGFYKVDSYDKNYWEGVSMTSLIHFSIKEFLKEEILPEKWCIKINEKNIKTVGEYYNKQLGLDVYLGKYLLSHDRISDVSVMKPDLRAVKNYITYLKPEGVPEITFEQFKKLILKETKMYTITSKQAQSIINIACEVWKGKLASMWSKKIVLGKKVEISEDFYKEMRKACTSDQNKLFDEIFGKEDILSFNTLKIGECIIDPLGSVFMKHKNGFIILKSEYRTNGETEGKNVNIGSFKRIKREDVFK